MRFRVTLALFASVFVVGAAFWSRFAAQNATSPELVASAPQDDGVSSDFLADYLTNGATTEEGPSSAGLVSRQLVLDFMDLVKAGEASNEDFEKLVDNYVENVPNLTTSPKITQLDLHTVEDGKENFEIYDEMTDLIERARRAKIKELMSEEDLVALGPTLYSSARAAGAAYDEAAIALRDMPVPISLAAAHVRLVNNFFASAAGLKAISSTEDDPMIAFAGMATLNTALKEEGVIINELIALLTKHGL